jgi:hypothetical protein
MELETGTYMFMALDKRGEEGWEGWEVGEATSSFHNWNLLWNLGSFHFEVRMELELAWTIKPVISNPRITICHHFPKR